MPNLLLITFTLLTCSFALVHQCNLDQNNLKCPQNSFCYGEGYCVCQKGWILDCKTESTPLTINSTKQAFTLQPSKQHLFSVVPSTLKAFSVYDFKLCMLDPPSSLFFSVHLWYDDGNVKQLSDSNLLGKKTIKAFKGCVDLTTTYIMFDRQVNGQFQFLVFGVSASEGQSIPQQKLTLSVKEAVVINADTIYLMYFIFGGIFFLVITIGISVCIYQIAKSRNNQRPKKVKNNVEHFEFYMPKKLFKKNKQRPEDTSCSVCLQQFTQTKEMVRQTNCNHIFHAECLDEWAQLNLVCPLCRASLDEGTLEMEFQESHDGMEQFEDNLTRMGKQSLKTTLINSQQ